MLIHCGLVMPYHVASYILVNLGSINGFHLFVTKQITWTNADSLPSDPLRTNLWNLIQHDDVIKW